MSSSVPGLRRNRSRSGTSSIAVAIPSFRINLRSGTLCPVEVKKDSSPKANAAAAFTVLDRVKGKVRGPGGREGGDGLMVEAGLEG